MLVLAEVGVVKAGGSAALNSRRVGSSIELFGYAVGVTIHGRQNILVGDNDFK